MATIQSNKIGKLNINLIQGDTKKIQLSFKDKSPLGVLTPMDLTQYTAIKMDVKTSVNVKETPFISFDLDSGLTISGDDNNILEFQFGAEFYDSQRTEWFYDIKFDKGPDVLYLIKGMITIELSITE